MNIMPAVYWRNHCDRNWEHNSICVSVFV